MPAQEDFATRYTGMALVLSTLFKIKFNDTLVTGRRPTIAEPGGPSSDHGLMATQHISLEQDGRPTISIGWVNCASNECELRTYDYMARMHKRRYPEQRFPIRKHEYGDFLKVLEAFLADRGMKVRTQDAKADDEVRTPSIQPTRHPEGSRRRVRLDIVIVVVLYMAVAVGAAFVVLDVLRARWRAPAAPSSPASGNSP